MNSSTISAVFNLDLEPIKFKLMDEESGLGWSLEKCDEVEKQYKKWLCLVDKYKDKRIAPSHYIDTFWHYHILDTKKYYADCNQALGYFLHHYPYAGMLNEQDKIDFDATWEETKFLFRKEFGIEINCLEISNSSASCDPEGCAPDPSCDADRCHGVPTDIQRVRPRPNRELVST